MRAALITWLVVVALGVEFALIATGASRELSWWVWMLALALIVFRVAREQRSGG